MCQALPSFYSDYNSKSLFISVSNDFYEKNIYILNIYIKKLIVFTLCTSTDSFRVLSHQVRKSSISLVVECSIIYDGKGQKKHQAYQGNDLFAKSSKNNI